VGYCDARSTIAMVIKVRRIALSSFE